MGSGHWSPDDWAKTSTSYRGATTDAIFTSAKVGAPPVPLQPKGIIVRESRDSTDHPLSTPIIVGLDVTGSMGMISDALAREGLGVLFSEILARKPVTDPHLMFMAIGDATCDRWPLQVSQFESDNRIIEQLTGIYLEGAGGGNKFESYDLPWYFAALHTSTDSWEKRGKRGYLFTVGDENAPPGLTKEQLKCHLGQGERGYTSAELLELAQRTYEVFHVVVEQGSHARHSLNDVLKTWGDLIGAQRVIRLSDYTKLSQVIVSAIQVYEGTDRLAVADSWDATTGAVVASAIKDLVVKTPAIPKGPVRLKAPEA